MILIQLFFEFFKIGLFSFGGGLATLPYLKDLAERTNWYSLDFLTDMIAISESTPGPIGINMATYVGYNVAGLAGAVIATVGEIVPSIIIVVLVSRFINKYRNNRIKEDAFYGMRPTVTALIAAAGVEIFYLIMTGESIMSFSNLYNYIDVIKLIMFVVILYLIRKFNKHPIFYIILSAIIGITLKLN